MSQHNALLIHTKLEFAENAKTKINVEGVDILFASTLDDVKRVLEEKSVDVALMGSPPEHLASRLQIVEYIKTWSYKAGKGPSIHFLGSSHPDDIAFIRAILESDLLK